MDNLKSRRKFISLSGVIGATAIISGCNEALGTNNTRPEENKEQKIINSISALRSLMMISSQVISVLSYHEDTSIGGGYFYWDETNTTDDDNGMVIKPNHLSQAQSGRWIRIITSHVITPDYFGAKYDGLNDDTEAVLKTIIFAQENRFHKIFFQSGIYNLPNWTTVTIIKKLSLEAAAGAELHGNGENFLHIQTDFYAAGLAFSNFGSIFLVKDINTYIDSFIIERCSVKNSKNLLFWLEGEDNTGAKKIAVKDCIGEQLSNRFIFAQPAMFDIFTVSDCRVYDVNNHAILIGNNNEEYFAKRKNIYLLNNTIEKINSTGDGIYDAPTFISGGNETQGILVYGHRTVITGNFIKNVGQSVGDSEGIYTKCLHVTVDHNTLIDAGGLPDGFLAIKDYRAEPLPEIEQLHKYNIFINGNVFISEKEVGARAISCQRAHVHLLNNKFIGTFSTGAYVVRLYGLLQKIKVLGNEFLLLDFSDGRKNIGCIRTSNNTRDLIFSNNYMQNWGQLGLSLGGDEAQWIIISNNQFKECGSTDTHSAAFGIDQKYLINSISVYGNIFEGMRSGVRLSLQDGGEGKKIIIKDNIFDKTKQLPILDHFTDVIVKDNILDS